MKKTMLAVLSSAAVLAGVIASVVPTATAATYYTPYKTHMVLNGNDFSDPFHIVAKEYSTAQPTSWLPIWYLFNVLKQLGIQSTWDGQNWNMQLPSGMQADLSNPSTVKGTIAIQINGTTVQHAPRIAYKEPGGTVATSYVPIWYIQQVMTRLGVQYSWDGTTWGMTFAAGPSITKATLAKDFVNALHIPADSSGTNHYDDVSATDWPYVNAVSHFIQADSATHFGSDDSSTVNMLDHAYQLFLGIPDDHMAWNAGGNLTNWANAIGLNNGIYPASGIPTFSEQQVINNLTGLLQGYTVDSDGTYHIVFKPYDAMPQWANNPRVNQALVTQRLVDSIQHVDTISFTVSGNTLTFTAPGIASSNVEDITIGSLFNASGNHTQYSLNQGSTWKIATGILGYDSWDSSNGGVANPPSTVLVKTTGHTEVGSGVLTPNQDAVGLLAIGITPNPSGPPTITCGVTAQ